MKHFILAALATLASFAVFAQSAQRYVVVCTTSCTTLTATKTGTPPKVVVTKTTHPAGYVANIILWNGVSPYTPPTGFELKQSDTLKIGDTTTP